MNYYSFFTPEQKKYLRSVSEVFQGLEPSYCVCFPLNLCDEVSKYYPGYAIYKSEEYAYFRFLSLEGKKAFLNSIPLERQGIFLTSQKCRTMVAIDKKSRRELSRVFIDTLEGESLKVVLDRFVKNVQANFQENQEKISCGKKYMFYTYGYFNQDPLLFMENFEIDGWSSDQLCSIAPSVREFKTGKTPASIVEGILEDRNSFPVKLEQVFLLSTADFQLNKDLIARLIRQGIRYEIIEINEGKATIVNKNDYKITDIVEYVIHRFNSDFPDVPANNPTTITHGFDFLSAEELRECSSVILYNRAQSVYEIMSAILAEIKGSKYDKNSHYFFFSNVSPNDKLTNDLKKYLENEGIGHETIQLSEKQTRKIVVNDSEFVVVGRGISPSRIEISDNAKHYMVCSTDGVKYSRVIKNCGRWQNIEEHLFENFNLEQLKFTAELFKLTFVDRRDEIH